MLVFYSGRGIAITPSRGTAVRCAFSAHFARGKTRRKQSVVAVHHTGQQPSSLRLGCVRSRVQISPSRPFSFPPFPFPGIYNKRPKTRERRTSDGWVQPEGLKDLYGVVVLPLIRLAVVHNGVVGTCGVTAEPTCGVWEHTEKVPPHPRRQRLYRAASIPTGRECSEHTRGRRAEGLLLILHHRNLRGQLEIDNRLKAAVILKEGRDRLARDYLVEYREILDSQLR